MKTAIVVIRAVVHVAAPRMLNFLIIFAGFGFPAAIVRESICAANLAVVSLRGNKNDIVVVILIQKFSVYELPSDQWWNSSGL